MPWSSLRPWLLESRPTALPACAWCGKASDRFEPGGSAQAVAAQGNVVVTSGSVGIGPFLSQENW